MKYQPNCDGILVKCITGKGQKTTISPSSTSWEVPISFLPKILFQLSFWLTFVLKHCLSLHNLYCYFPLLLSCCSQIFYIFWKALIFYSRRLMTVWQNSFLICCSFVSFSWRFFPKYSAYLTCSCLTCANIFFFFFKFWSC